MKKPSLPTPEAPPQAPPPEPDSVLGMHHSNLQSLSKALVDLEHLFDRWTQLNAELETAEAQIGDTVTELLSGDATDTAFSEKSIRIASLQAQINALRKRANSSGTALQHAMQKDYLPPCEWLALLWFEHRLRVETSKILELVTEVRRGTVVEAAKAVALVSISYCASVDELPPCAPSNYGWQRPIEPMSEKSWISQKIINDPLFQAPSPLETIANLLAAAQAQRNRWESLLIAIGLDPAFSPPSSYQQPEAVVWQPAKLEQPREPRLKPTWEASDLEQVPWEQKAS